MHILRNVESSRDFRVWVLAAVLLCLLGTLEAQSVATGAAKGSSTSQTYVIPLAPRCTQPHKVDVSVAYPAANAVRASGWDVSVAVDTADCKMYCTFHRKHLPGMPASLLDQAIPIATIHVYGKLGPSASVVVLDPAGVTLPDVRNYLAFAPPIDGANSRRYFLATVAARSEKLAGYEDQRFHLDPFAVTPGALTPLPLRI